MDCYNIILYLLKSLIKPIKKFVFGVCFIIAILLFIGSLSSVSATTFTYEGLNGSAFTQNDVNDIETCFNNVKGSARYYVLSCKLGQSAKMCVFDDYNPPKFYVDLAGNSRIISTDIFSYRLYWLNGGGSTTFIGSYNTTLSYEMQFSYVNSLPMVYGNLPLYNDSSLTTGFWCPDGYSDFIAPSVNPCDLQDQTILTSGDFTFFIVNPGSVSVNSTMSLACWDFSDDYNGENPVVIYTLDKNSAFFEYTNVDQTEYKFFLTARFLSWFKLINGKKYRLVLAYFDNNNNYQTITYDWTMSISASQQQVINDTTQQDINQGIQDVNSYLNNQEFDENSIIDNMPSVTINSPTDNLLDNLFNSLRNAFVNTEPINFEFTIPNSNGQKIIIPSNYISSHLPNVIIVIIQTFYWYMIARYILMDAWHTIDKMRQGTYYTGADGDIKTEVL